MKRETISRRAWLRGLAVLIASSAAVHVLAQQLAAPPPPPPAHNARAGALIDVTGTWVPVITQDWSIRMVTPPKGEFSNLTLNPVGRAVAMRWDPNAPVPKGELCRTYGAPAIVQLPGRMRISWKDDFTLRLDFELGSQTRLVHFAPPGFGALPQPPQGPPSWQGYSVGEWTYQKQWRGFDRNPAPHGPGQGGALRVKTSRLRAGFLRANGVPYSGRTTLTEYFRRFNLPNGEQWLVVISSVDDPVYLAAPYVTSSLFKRETGKPSWSPLPCEFVPPLQDAAPPDVREANTAVN